MNYALKIRGVVSFIIASFVILVGLLYFKDVFAACDPGTSPSRADFLVTSPTLSGKFYSAYSPNGVCIVNGDAQDVAFDEQTVPTYDQFKNTYYTGSKYQRELTVGEVSSGLLTLDNQYSYHTIENLSLKQVQSTAGSAVALIFIDGNLEITSNILFGKGDINSGLVFIVKGNVYIRSTVTEINAVIISEGKILTAAPLNGSCDPDAFTQTLTINGSLISINPASAINFCRRNSDKLLPGEIINNQAKYLILLKNTLSSPVQKWSEIVEIPGITVASPPTPTPGLTPTPGPTPTPTPTPAPIPTIAGPSSPTTADTSAPCVGTDWVNPGNVLSSDNLYATVTLSNTYSKCLLARSYNFSIPAEAVIDGIKIEVEGVSPAGNTAVEVWTSSFNVLRHAQTATLTPAEGYISLGGPTDLWGETSGYWTPDRINNNADFAAALRVYPAITGTVSIDHIRTTVYYHFSCPTPTTWYADKDSDGYGDPNVKTITCSSILPSGYVLDNTDCNDDPASGGQYVYQTKSVAKDADQDSYTTTTTTSNQCVGGTKSISGRTYYMDNTGLSYSWLAPASAQVDCDDSNANIYQNVAVAKDADHDSYTTTTTTSNQCVGSLTCFDKKGALVTCTTQLDHYYKDAIGNYTWDYRASATVDCDDNNKTITLGGPWYQDTDGDTYGAGTGITGCVNPDPTKYVANKTDCYDSNANAKPGQTAYFSTNRGDLSFDYDCVSGPTKNPDLNCVTNAPSVCTSSFNIPYHAGFAAISPSCGQSSSWYQFITFPDQFCSTGKVISSALCTVSAYCTASGGYCSRTLTSQIMSCH